MASFNRVVLVGNVTRDVELKYIPSGTAVVELGLAVNDRRKGNDGEWIEETTFVDVTLWGRTAEVANEYLGKGASVLIEGRLKLDTWEDRESGQKRSKLRVVGEKMVMLGSKGQSGGQNGSGGDRQQASQQNGQQRGNQNRGGGWGGGSQPAASGGQPEYSDNLGDIPF